MNNPRKTDVKKRILFVFSLVSILVGLSLFVGGVILARIVGGDLYYLIAFAGLPLLWLGSYLWRTARHLPFLEDLPTQSGSVTCTCVEVPREQESKNKK